MTKISAKDKRILLGIVAISILLKLIFLFASGAYLAPQIFEYEGAAEHLLEGGGFYYLHFGAKYYGGIAPGFPLLCYGIYKIFGHHRLLIIFMQIIITSLLPVPIFSIARRIFDSKTAVIASVLTAIHPPFIVYATTKLHAMNIYSFLFALFIWAIFLLEDSITFKRVIAVGIVSALMTLFRVTGLALFILGISWFLMASAESQRRKARAISAAFLIYFLILLPWGIRNYVVFGKPLFLQTNKWESLWFGNIPSSSGSLYYEGGVSIPDKATEDFPREFFKMNELQQGEYLKGLTISYFKENPVLFITKIFKKMFYFWYFSPHQGTLYPKSWMRIYKIYYLFILLPAIFSVIYNFIYLKKDRREVALIGILLFALTCIHSLYFLEARHRWSVEALVLIFTANTIMILSRIFKRRLVC